MDPASSRLPCSSLCDKNNSKGFMAAPGLLLAWKQIYAEALKIYYNKTEFRFASASRIVRLLSRIGSTGGHGGDLTCVALSRSAVVGRIVCGGYVRFTAEQMAFKDFGKLTTAFGSDKIVEGAKLVPETVVLKYRDCAVRDYNNLDKVPFKTWAMEEFTENWQTMMGYAYHV